MAERIKIAETPVEIAACFPVMQELRPHLDAQAFEKQIGRLRDLHGYRLAFLEDGDVVCVAGLRIGEWLHQGRYLEIEDFVSKNGARSKGYGGRLFDWIAEYGRSRQCNHIRLVSALSRDSAHRFYERKGMQRFACYFTMDL
ncbi:GNAT family N-acetyltransferase [Nitratireductor soli]|uniref:GNAT family N-acetyltransferase n=1 Tax=Nitratireductor soli TaxID=1670619 RepID=UPI00065E54D4|nr:GNAT family N-acetyltransferase [Nitratireductor soli]